MSSAAARNHTNAALFAVFAAGALAPLVALRGFTVDDALITARYAAHIANGHGYRLNVAGPITDGVTPLGFAYLLAPFAKDGPLAALSAAKLIGAISWVLAASVIGLAVARVLERSLNSDAQAAEPEAARRPPRSLWLVPFALLVTSAPLGAWASAGMETGFVTALGALGAALPILDRPRLGALCAGLAAGLRPELAPWAATLSMGTLLTRKSEPLLRRAAPLLLSIAPFCLVAAVRLAIFGRPAPLSIFAKAPDARLGLLYATACAILAGPPILLAPFAMARLRGVPRALVASVLVHLLAMALAGGDWMPLSRLIVPVLPSLLLGALYLACEAALWATAVRLAIALAGQVFVLVHIGPVAAQVGKDRARVLEELRPALATSRVIASLDIGWVGALTDAPLVDLAGVTDPAIAALPGGHTSKQIPVGLLDARGADTLVLLLAPGEQRKDPWTRSRFARPVEAWIAAAPGIGEAFAPVAESSLPYIRYIVLRKTR